ncbi:MAG: putative short-chain dehydrogenase [Streblomastix strix]|uniref:Putative short-chain dehydrogenase n=1 Tax=Streblomastix strix TaxID=222440 RepID=A0A5J4X1S1_9EUKA|nr:MAG: putative short-chain dehydrogenase [Streblomastix strix]
MSFLKFLLLFGGSLYAIKFVSTFIIQLLARFLPKQNLKKKYITDWGLVTGGSSGIGRAMVEELASQGLNVVIVAYPEPKFDEAIAELRAKYPQREFRQLNIDLAGDEKAIAKEITDAVADIDIGVMHLNAGICLLESAFAPTKRTLAEFHINVVSHMHIFYALYPRIATRKRNPKNQKRGAVFFTSSSAMQMPLPYSCIYGGTKAYIGHFASYLSCEAHASGVDIVSAIPGFVNTRLTENIPGLSEVEAMEKIGQPPSEIASAFVRNAGRITEVDCGAIEYSARFLASIIDRNFFIYFHWKTAYKQDQLKKMVPFPDLPNETQ